MNVPFTLNGFTQRINTEPHRRSLDVLREDLQCRSLYRRCHTAQCGSCLIMVDGKLSFSCSLPAFELRSRDVWTMEGLENQKGYEDIVEGFQVSGIQLCAFCAASRALSTEVLIRKTTQPSTMELQETAHSVLCDCASFSCIIDAIREAARCREKKINGS